MTDGWNLLASVAGIALGTGLLTSIAARPLGRWTGLVDSRERDTQGRPLSRMGGSALLVAWCVGIAAGGALSASLLTLVACGSAAWLLGLHDDFTDSSPRLRLAVLALLATAAAALGLRAESIALPGLGPVALGFAAIPLSALWILGTTVAFNFIDGLDGLALGLGFLTVGGLLLLAGTGVWAVPLAALLGAQLGVLCLNRPAASLYLGDNGSNLLGFVIGTLLIAGLQEGGSFPALAALLLIALPVTDAGMTMLRRARSGDSLFQSDLGHLHHRLLGAGQSRWTALLLLLGTGGLFAGLAVLLGGS
ncbi:MAG: MraY family glycosyltransferase [Myxococcota bacterium]|nr:MraY family glycosyltransferase [Myxococcota bacterium]